MRHLYVLVLVLCFPSSTYAQNTFEKVIDTLGTGTFQCVQQTFDGGFIACGANSNGVGGGNVVVIKFDSLGTIEWAKDYIGSGADGGRYIEQTPDSGYMVCAVYTSSAISGKCWLLRLNQQGDTLWTKIYSAGVGGTNLADQNSMASLNNSIYAMTGYLNPPTQWAAAFMMPVLNNGYLLGAKIYDYSIWGTVSRAINKTTNNGFILAGGYALSSNSGDAYLIRTDAYGDTIWTRTYHNSSHNVGQAVQQTSDGGFIVGGYAQNSVFSQVNAYLIKTDSVGDTLWTKMFGGAVECYLNAIQQTTDGGYIGLGCIVNGTPAKGYLYHMKFDANGDTLWTKQFVYGHWGNGTYVRQTTDGGYILSGVTYNSNGPIAYLIKTDSIGNVLTGLNMIEVNNQYGFSVFPNPSSGSITIKLSDNTHQNALIEIYDANNRRVYTGKIDNSLNKQINLSHVANGLYVAILKTKGKTVARKFMVSK